MKNRKIDFISLFLLLGPFLDVASFLGIGEPLSISMMIRTLFLCVLTILLLKKKDGWKEVIGVIVISIILFGYSYFSLKQGLSTSLSSTLKLIYLPVVLLYFKSYPWEGEKNKVLEIILFTYLIIFVSSYLLGIGADAYLETDGKSGFKGLFSSINEFSAIVVSLLFFVGCVLKKEKQYLKLILLFVLCIVVSLLIGTKVLLGGILFTLVYFAFLERQKIFFERSFKVKCVILSTILIAVVGGGFLFTKTRTYQNMKVQQTFFKANNILSYNFLNRVLFNDRLTFLKDNFDYYKDQSLPRQLFGIGMLEDEVKMVEIDTFDILFRYGIISLIIFAGILILLIPWRKLQVESMISIILLLLISCTSGHVLFYPAVCIYFGCFSTFFKEQKKN